MTTVNQHMASIFCDGACSGNGTKKALGGWAWAYWPGAAIGEPAHFGSGHLTEPATNQRAELTALLEALRWWSGSSGGSITIYSDSMYAINCTSTWGPGWKKKGWTKPGGPIQNLDLIQPLVELWKPIWRLQHVQGHQRGSSPEAHGNNWVDQAAVAAAQNKSVPVTSISPMNKSPFPASTAQSDIRRWFGVCVDG